MQTKKTYQQILGIWSGWFTQYKIFMNKKKYVYDKHECTHIILKPKGFLLRSAKYIEQRGVATPKLLTLVMIDSYGVSACDMFTVNSTTLVWYVFKYNKYYITQANFSIKYPQFKKHDYSFQRRQNYNMWVPYCIILFY